jgi:hypothetical protein
MDRITQALLGEFSKEHSLHKLPEEKQFEHFACFLTVSRFLSEAFDTSNIVTGAGGDTGIDGIAVIINGSLVFDVDAVQDFIERNGYLDVDFIFIQAKRVSNFESAAIGQFGFGVQNFFDARQKLPRNAAVKTAAAIMTEVYNQSSKFKRGNPTCKLYYVTTGRWLADPALETRRQTVVADLEELRLFSKVEFVPVDADNIQRLYRESKNSVTREFDFPLHTVVPNIPDVKEAYVGLLPGTEFLKLVEDDSGEILKSIFYDNVRDWQDYNPVNSEMRDTLLSKEQRSRFALMNNGITIIAKTLRRTGNRFHIEDYQIVNGCQTSHVLHEQSKQVDGSVIVPLRIISAENDDVIASIIKATNRQTEVKTEQLLAVSDVQKKLESFLQATEEARRLYYERRSRQYNNIAGIDKTRIITPGNLIRSFASIFLEEPHRTTRNYKSLVERVGKAIFVENDRLEPYQVSAVALYRLERLFHDQEIDTRFKYARYQILFAFRLLASNEVPPKMNSNKMQRYCDNLLNVLWNREKSTKLFKQATAIVSELCGDKLDMDVLRTQPFNEKLKKRLPLNGEA